MKTLCSRDGFLLAGSFLVFSSCWYSQIQVVRVFLFFNSLLMMSLFSSFWYPSVGMCFVICQKFTWGVIGRGYLLFANNLPGIEHVTMLLYQLYDQMLTAVPNARTVSRSTTIFHSTNLLQSAPRIEHLRVNGSAPIFDLPTPFTIFSTFLADGLLSLLSQSAIMHDLFFLSFLGPTWLFG